MDKNVRLKILFEINEIDIQLDMYKNLLTDTKNRVPDIVETSAIAAVIHSFYNGIEKTFEIIAKKLDKFIPTSGRTHQELLNHVCMKNDARPAIIDEEAYKILKDYMDFRHFFRHGYLIHLDWERMKDLSYNIFDAWKTVKKQLLNFADFLENNDLNKTGE